MSNIHSPVDTVLEDSKDHDRLLPIANVVRIMKKSLPENAKISKDAKDAVQECVSEYIIHITREAGRRCQLENRKTITGDDMLWAMKTLGLEKYASVLQQYLDKYRDSMKIERLAATSAISYTERQT
ncbi:Nuclear transcription factor Y subunit B-3 [Podila humilis]|nr:Nuclear transcription factor Y subunit B-3 [Podila humilis]